jgi:3-deoxy-manno-octulosonate cytidylyltransferase (CMP-KDO synthetase)
MITPGTPRTVVIIPARFGSTRLPGKPLAEIAGKPMIQHVYERASRAELVHDVIVATDDMRIVAAVEKFGGHAVITPVDAPSGSDRIAYVASRLRDAEIVVNVQGDEPFIPPAMIDEAIRPVCADPHVQVGTLARRIEHIEDLQDPAVVKVVLGRNGNALYFSRSSIPYGRDITATELLAHVPVYRHIGLYVYRREFLLHYTTLPQTPLEQAEKLEQLRILEHGYPIRVAVTTHHSIAVDTPADLERARAMAGTPL